AEALGAEDGVGAGGGGGGHGGPSYRIVVLGGSSLDVSSIYEGSSYLDMTAINQPHSHLTCSSTPPVAPGITWRQRPGATCRTGRRQSGGRYDIAGPRPATFPVGGAPSHHPAAGDHPAAPVPAAGADVRARPGALLPGTGRGGAGADRRPHADPHLRPGCTDLPGRRSGRGAVRRGRGTGEAVPDHRGRDRDGHRPAGARRAVRGDELPRRTAPPAVRLG